MVKGISHHGRGMSDHPMGMDTPPFSYHDFVSITGVGTYIFHPKVPLPIPKLFFLSEKCRLRRCVRSSRKVWLHSSQGIGTTANAYLPS